MEHEIPTIKEFEAALELFVKHKQYTKQSQLIRAGYSKMIGQELEIFVLRTQLEYYRKVLMEILYSYNPASPRFHSQFEDNKRE